MNEIHWQEYFQCYQKDVIPDDETKHRFEIANEVCEVVDRNLLYLKLTFVLDYEREMLIFSLYTPD